MILTIAVLLSLLIYFAVPTVVTVVVYKRINASVPTILSFVSAMLVQQLLFALFAHFFSAYSIAFPAAMVSTLFIIFSVIKFPKFWGDVKATNVSSQNHADENKLDGVTQGVPWVIGTPVLLVCLWIRSQYASIEFFNNGNDVGVEKLFNLSLQQSFLFGSSYPPQWIWLAGEPITYYAFLKSIPGVWSWLARVLAGNSATGGVFFIISESFYTALVPAVLSGWIFWFAFSDTGAEKVKGKYQYAIIWTLGVLTGLFPLVGTHWHAFSMGMHQLFSSTSNFDWWELTKQVPFTDNQYPAWLVMLGDNHAYFQVYFVEVLFWGLFTAVFISDRCSVAVSVLTGAVAAILTISHPGSILVDLSSLGVLVFVSSLYFLFKKDFLFLLPRLKNAGIVVATALFFIAVLYKPAGHVKFVVPDVSLLTTVGDALQLQFSVLVFLGFCIVASYVAPSSWREGLLGRIQTFEWVWVLTIIAGGIAVMCSRPALCVPFIVSAVVFILFSESNRQSRQSLLAMVAAASFFIWIPPELIAFDHMMDNRTDWIRFQMSLRFWPEGFLLLPFIIAVVSTRYIRTIRLAYPIIGVATLLIVAFGATHQPGFKNRIQRTHQAVTIDGFQQFATKFPSDNAIISFLRSMSDSADSVVITESCGFGDPRIPVDFGWAGRIAAFSGRAGVCGWARHAALYNSPLTQVGFKGMSVVDSLSLYQRNFLMLFSAVEMKDSIKAAIAIEALRSFGVTHIIFGQQEQRLFPTITSSMIATICKGAVVFANADGTGVIQIS